jgi:hypothetical protein
LRRNYDWFVRLSAIMRITTPLLLTVGLLGTTVACSRQGPELTQKPSPVQQRLVNETYLDGEWMLATANTLKPGTEVKLKFDFIERSFWLEMPADSVRIRGRWESKDRVVTLRPFAPLNETATKALAKWLGSPEAGPYQLRYSQRERCELQSATQTLKLERIDG